MGIQDSVNSMIGSVAMVTGSKKIKEGLNDVKAASTAQEQLAMKFDAMREQRNRISQWAVNNSIPVVQADAVRVSDVKIPGGK